MEESKIFKNKLNNVNNTPIDKETLNNSSIKIYILNKLKKVAEKHQKIPYVFIIFETLLLLIIIPFSLNKIVPANLLIPITLLGSLFVLIKQTKINVFFTNGIFAIIKIVTFFTFIPLCGGFLIISAIFANLGGRPINDFFLLGSYILTSFIMNIIFTIRHKKLIKYNKTIFKISANIASGIFGIVFFLVMICTGKDYNIKSLMAGPFLSMPFVQGLIEYYSR